MAGENRCPRCEVELSIRLEKGEVCPDCRSALAWETYAKPGAKLVVDRPAIEEAEARREGKHRRPPWRAVAPILAAGLAVAAAAALFQLFRTRPIGPLAPMLEEIRATSSRAVAFGIGATVAGAAAAVVLARSRLFRAWPLTVLALLGLACGLGASAIGALQLVAIGSLDWKFSVMPALSTATDASHAARSIRMATTVVIAPDEDGDASNPAIGAGAVIHTTRNRAWIVTCSHVAMPYAAVRSFRDAARAQPVWVYFADGRQARGTLDWAAPPPLDVAVVRVEIDDPPDPVRVVPATEELGRGSRVMHVPNPFRDGWIAARGSIVRRKHHFTNAGPLSLIVTDLDLKPGDSGSGLFDADARLIGLNTWRGVEESGPVGISLPADTMQAILERIARDGSEPR